MTLGKDVPLLDVEEGERALVMAALSVREPSTMRIFGAGWSLVVLEGRTGVSLERPEARM